MNLKQSFLNLSSFEKELWFSSIWIIIFSFTLFDNKSYLVLIASLCGTTALILIAKGDVNGQYLTIIFSLLYAVISFNQQYYGEMITYIGMTTPISLLAIYSWVKHPYDKHAVKINNLTFLNLIKLSIITIIVTFIFHFILRSFGTASLTLSTISITTSFSASSLMFLRSPYYALAYCANDLVLILLWIIATLNNIIFLPFVMCFFVFLINDIYGFINWRKMHDTQKENN